MVAMVVTIATLVITVVMVTVVTRVMLWRKIIKTSTTEACKFTGKFSLSADSDFFGLTYHGHLGDYCWS